ncbi:hypothetical protein HMPREF1402_00247 [Helicobacter pylori GAM121Aii]|nr:hypothetical protein HMPREF1402_00247 [Helicobacter pylori GAM121Aii]
MKYRALFLNSSAPPHQFATAIFRGGGGGRFRGHFFLIGALSIKASSKGWNIFTL